MKSIYEEGVRINHLSWLEDVYRSNTRLIEAGDYSFRLSQFQTESGVEIGDNGVLKMKKVKKFSVNVGSVRSGEKIQECTTKGNDLICVRSNIGNLYLYRVNLNNDEILPFVRFCDKNIRRFDVARTRNDFLIVESDNRQYISCFMASRGTNRNDVRIPEVKLKELGYPSNVVKFFTIPKHDIIPRSLDSVKFLTAGVAIRIYDFSTTTKKPVMTLSNENIKIINDVVVIDPTKIAAVTSEGLVKLFDLRMNQKYSYQRFGVSKKPIWKAKYSHWDHSLFTIHEDGHFVKWNLNLYERKAEGIEEEEDEGMNDEDEVKGKHKFRILDHPALSLLDFDVLTDSIMKHDHVVYSTKGGNIVYQIKSL